MRRRSLLMSIAHGSFEVCVSDIVEMEEIPWNGRLYYPYTETAGFQELLWSPETGQFMGVELQLGTFQSESLLFGLPRIVRMPPMPTIADRWQIRLCDGLSDIRWDQVLTSNPYCNSDRVLIVAQLDHLSDQDYESVRNVVDAIK